MKRILNTLLFLLLFSTSYSQVDTTELYPPTWRPDSTIEGDSISGIYQKMSQLPIVDSISEITLLKISDLYLSWPDDSVRYIITAVRATGEILFVTKERKDERESKPRPIRQ